MKKYEYKLAAYKLEISTDLATSIERTFNKEGSEGWELVEWQPCLEPLDATSLTQSTKKSVNILATWKREIKLSN